MTIMQRMRELHRSIRGQSVVEFAMVLPLMLVVMFLITEFGRALWIKNTLTQAAREGARQAVVGSVSPSAKVGVAEDISTAFLREAGMLDSTEPAPVVVAEGITVNGYEFVRVTITRDFSFIPDGQLSANPFGSGAVVIPTGFTIRAQAIMKAENLGT